jgi:DNA polymerase III subunit delta'
MEDNWDMIGHQWAVSLLSGQIERQNTSHAYLFTGPTGVGRRTLALKLATKINQPQSSTPEESNLYSKQMERMEHVDLSVLKRNVGEKNIKIDAVRALQKSVYLSPYMASNRIALILNFEDANPSAANAILKTLEEPPKSTILLLTAANVESLLPTIVSRCEEIRLRPLPIEEVAKGLETKWNVSFEQANLLAHISGGRVGYALYLQQNPDVLAQREKFISQHIMLLSAGRVARFQYAQQSSKDRESFMHMLQIWLSFWRDMMVVSVNQNNSILNLDMKKEINQFASQIPASIILNTVRLIENTMKQMHYNINLRLAAESMLLEIPSI